MRKTIAGAISVAIITLFIGCQSDGVTTDQDEVFRAEMDSIFSQLPNSIGLVNDFGKVLKPNEEELLLKHVKSINAKNQLEVVLVTVDSIKPFEDMVSYATALGNKWDIGNVEQNNGLVVLVSAHLGQVAIVPGNGIEGVFSEEITQKIIDLNMVPHFMKGDFYAGLERALRQVDSIGIEAKKPS